MLFAGLPSSDRGLDVLSKISRFFRRALEPANAVLIASSVSLYASSCSRSNALRPEACRRERLLPTHWLPA